MCIGLGLNDFLIIFKIYTQTHTHKLKDFLCYLWLAFSIFASDLLTSSYNVFSNYPNQDLNPNPDFFQNFTKFHIHQKRKVFGFKFILQ
jgi:hypothetical protein